MNLALGTAQFGLDYGIANREGKTSVEEIKKIINIARTLGIDTLDTAVSYGDSEACLGSLGIKDFKIITKLSELPSEPGALSQQLKAAIQTSLVRLKINSLYALMLHRSDLVNEENVGELQTAIESLKTAGLVSKFGVSIYNPQELDRILPLIDIDIIQAPFNLLDRRLETSGWLQRLHDRGIEIHIRSVFLQGLLLMPPETLPSKFTPWAHIFRQLSDWTQKHETDLLSVCFSAVDDYRVIRTVIGVNSARQLNQIGNVLETLKKIPFPNLSSTDLKLINPANWKYL